METVKLKWEIEMRDDVPPTLVMFLIPFFVFIFQARNWKQNFNSASNLWNQIQIDSYTFNFKLFVFPLVMQAHMSISIWNTVVTLAFNNHESAPMHSSTFGWRMNVYFASLAYSIPVYAFLDTLTYGIISIIRQINYMFKWKCYHGYYQSSVFRISDH